MTSRSSGMLGLDDISDDKLTKPVILTECTVEGVDVTRSGAAVRRVEHGPVVNGRR